MTEFLPTRGIVRVFAAVLAFVTVAAHADADIDAPVSPAPAALSVERPAGAGAASLRISGPEGFYREVGFAAGEAIELDEQQLEGLATREGAYLWEVHFHWAVPRSRDDDEKQTPAGSMIQPVSGSLRRSGDEIFVGQASVGASVGLDGGGNMPSDVITGDLTVYNSLCVGQDCAAAESYGADTIRLKENNLRIHFDDTSASGSFPSNDWTLIANDDLNGGMNMFAIQDRTAGRNIMTLQAGAPANSLFVRNNGNVGMGTGSPAVQLHVADGNTPALRLDQTAASGFTPQVWDVAGNEANFFVRDVTGGSNLVFRLIPGAPEDSIYVASSGNVGLGTNSPAARLHVANGDLRVDGSVYQLSSRAVKTEFATVEPEHLLGLLERLELGRWNYIAGSDRAPHFGPAAEDFHAAFGLGDSGERISLSDMAGVALGAAQALKLELDEKEREIEALEARLERLERALLADGEEG
ncbi:MAG: ABC transporter C-terminal domain-containing protein [Wenzhouxiangella sp.]|jgi:hypothetical protein|nr:ABC transporter C-terminal domain-containing protein [Wenzhouxiangella sp.]